MDNPARKIDHLEVTIDPYAPLYAEPITFVEQCKLLSEPIRHLQIAWGNKDTFPRVLEILMHMNWYAQRLPLQPKGSFARPSGFMECSIKRAIHTLQILTTLSFYPRLPTIRKYQEIERVKLTAVIAALLSSVGEPAVIFEVMSYDNNHQLIRRKNEYERLDNFLAKDADSIHINFQDPPPKEFYSSIAIDLMHEIVPEDLMQDIALAYDRNLRRFLQNFVGRNFIQAEVANHKLFNCLISADVITQDREFAFSGKRLDKTPLPHLQHEMEIVLAHKFKDDWSMEAGKSKFCRCVTLWKGELWIRYPLGFEEIAELARQKWPFTEIPLNAQSLFSYCSYLGIVKQPPNSDLEERVFLEPQLEKANQTPYVQISCPAVVLNEPLLYLEEASAWAQELKNSLPEKVLEEKLKRKPNLKNIVADPDKKKADTTLAIRNKRESTLPAGTRTYPKIIAMVTEMINTYSEQLRKERQIKHESPIVEAKKSVNDYAIKALNKQKTQEMEESLKKENLYPFNHSTPPAESTTESDQLVELPTSQSSSTFNRRKHMSILTIFKKLFGYGSQKDLPKEKTKQEATSNSKEVQPATPKETVPSIFSEMQTTAKKKEETFATLSNVDLGDKKSSDADGKATDSKKDKDPSKSFSTHPSRFEPKPNSQDSERQKAKGSETNNSSSTNTTKNSSNESQNQPPKETKPTQNLLAKESKDQGTTESKDPKDTKDSKDFEEPKESKDPKEATLPNEASAPTQKKDASVSQSISGSNSDAPPQKSEDKEATKVKAPKAKATRSQSSSKSAGKSPAKGSTTTTRTKASTKTKTTATKTAKPKPTPKTKKPTSQANAAKTKTSNPQRSTKAPTKTEAAKEAALKDREDQTKLPTSAFNNQDSSESLSSAAI